MEERCCRLIRLYKLAMDSIREIAEETLSPIAIKQDDSTYHVLWYTGDDKEFEDKDEALNHQIEYLMEEIE